MLLEGKVVCPIADRREIFPQALVSKFGASTLLIEAASGYLHTGWLAGVLEKQGKQIVWLRLDSKDNDPAVLLYSLVAAIQQINPQIGQDTLTQMQRLPGPLQGWPGLFSMLANEITGGLQPASILVLEHFHQLTGSSQSPGLLLNAFLPLLPHAMQLILTSQEPLPLIRGRDHAFYIGAPDLQLPPQMAFNLLDNSGVLLPKNSLRQVMRLSKGRAVVLDRLGYAARILGVEGLEHSLEHHHNPESMMGEITRRCLLTSGADDLTVANILAFLGYYHPEFSQRLTGTAAITDEPWMQLLTHNWVRPFRQWREVLKKGLLSQNAFTPNALCAAADMLCQNTSWLDGIELLFSLGCYEFAAQRINQIAPTLLQSGLWETASHWLGHIPPAVLRSQPWLLQASAEMKALLGDYRGALPVFQQAVKIFRDKHDPAGVCASLLALSTTAARLGELGTAWASADEACLTASEAHIPWQQGWAEFQLACLSIKESNQGTAAVHLHHAIELSAQAGEPRIQEYMRSIEALVMQQCQLQAQRVHEQQAYYEVRRLERSQREQLEHVLQIPPQLEEQLGPAHNWLHIPLGLIAPIPTKPDGNSGTPTSTHRWQDWLHRLRLGGLKAASKSRPAVPANGISKLVYLPHPGEYPPPSVETEKIGSPSQQSDEMLPFIPGSPPYKTSGSENIRGVESRENPEPVKNISSTEKILTVYLLGSFRIIVQDSPLLHLPGGRSGMLLKFLVCHHQRQMPREQLMEVFWPGTDPDAARNRLNVALSSLRQALRSVTEADVVLFEDGKYGLDAAWKVWIDTEEFERSLETARLKEASGNTDQAIQCLEVVANLYQGDFLQDDPYEEWTVPVRERLRLAYLDALYQLSRHYFQQEQYAACAALCQRILERDRCREDVHCLLMRCYANQNQIPLALRQYQACVDALRQELDVEPAMPTISLYKQLYRHGKSFDD